jgi:HAD superfamily PSPase-like hydrolase
MTPEEKARRVRVVCFDVDGTLVQHPQEKTVWQLLNERFLAEEDLSTGRFEAFRSGKISYDEWVRLDLSDWVDRGVRRAEIEEIIRAELAPAPGARRTIETLAQRGYRVAVVSGTIHLTLELLLGGVAFDRIFSNRIFFDDDGAISGWEATPFDVTGKVRALEQVAADYGVDASRCAFVGDAWNDLPALERAGLAVAYRPKLDAVREVADVVIENGSLERLLDLLRAPPGSDDE